MPQPMAAIQPQLVCVSRRCAGKSVPASPRVTHERESKYVSRSWPLCDPCLDAAEGVARRWGHRAPRRALDPEDYEPPDAPDAPEM